MNSLRLRPISLRLALVALSAILLPRGTGAQALPAPKAPPAGTRVQLELGDRRQVRGILLGRVGDRIFLAMSNRDTVGITSSDIIRASRYDGASPRGWSAVGKGAAVGAGFGLMLGALTLSHTGSGRGESMAIVGVLASGAALVVGTFVGGMFAVLPEDHWAAFEPSTIAEAREDGAAQ